MPKHTTQIHNGMKYIQKQDIESRITELEALGVCEPGDGDPEEPDSEEATELHSLRSLIDDIGTCGGMTLISEREFPNYCEETAYDIGEVERDSGIVGYIDWERYAEDIKIDWHEVDFDGETYLIRS